LPASAQTAITEQEAHAIAVDAYLYFYPLVSMDVTRKQSTNVEPGKEFGKGPMNLFRECARIPPGNLKLVVRVNFDTLYSLTWLDMTARASGRLCAKYQRSLLPSAYARYVDRRVCVTGLAYYRHGS
jgi:hypothetical protein